MDIYEIQDLMRKKAEAIGQYAAKAPQTEADLRSSLFGSDQTLASLRENEAMKIKELYNHDKILASNYVPQTPGFIEDPGAKASFGSDVLARQGGELADIQKGIANRRDILGDALDKGLKLFLSGLDALKYEQSALQDAFNNELRLKEMQVTAEERASTKSRQKQSDILSILKETGGEIPAEILSNLGLSPGLKIPRSGGEQLTDQEIKAGVTTFDSNEVRNKKLAEYLKNQEDPTKIVQGLKDEGYKKQDVENYIKQQKGIIPTSLQNAINQVYGEEKNQGIIPDWIPGLGRF